MRGNTFGFGQEICVNGTCGRDDSRKTAMRHPAQVADTTQVEPANRGSVFRKCSNPSLLCGLLTVLLVGTGVGIGSWYVATME